MRYLIIGLISLVLAGCVSPQGRVATMEYEEMNAQPTSELCEVYGNKTWRNEKIKTILIEREAIKPNEWKLAANEELADGMSECALLSSWGPPHTINRNANGRDQWVYRNLTYGNPYKYVYVQGGKIVAWQN